MREEECREKVCQCEIGHNKLFPVSEGLAGVAIDNAFFLLVWPVFLRGLLEAPDTVARYSRPTQLYLYHCKNCQGSAKGEDKRQMAGDEALLCSISRQLGLRLIWAGHQV